MGRWRRGTICLRTQKQETDRQPGERLSYSNIAYDLLGNLLAKVTGQPFERAMRERLLIPAGMPNSTFLLAEAPPERLAVPHLRAPEMVVNHVYPYHRADAPASFLHSTVDAVQQWTGDSFLVFRHHRLRTGAGFLRIAIESTRAGVYTIEQFFRALLEIGG